MKPKGIAGRDMRNSQINLAGERSTLLSLEVVVGGKGRTKGETKQNKNKNQTKEKNCNTKYTMNL